MLEKKLSKPHLVAKRKLNRITGADKKPAKQLPDTSRILWLPAIPKTGTDP